MKINPNIRCPCGSGQKFKRCCQGKVDWVALFTEPDGAAGRKMSVRGKNQAFLNVIHVLIRNLDFSTPSKNKAFKAQFTPEVVHQLFAAVDDLWPDQADAVRALEQEKEGTAGIYVGDYDLSSVINGVTRHSLYADSILLMDPFAHPKRFKAELNPLRYPEIHVANAIKAARLWITMAPWIQSGIVRFIHAPPYFNYSEYITLLEKSRARIKEHPELVSSLDSDVEGAMHEPDDLTKYQILTERDDMFLASTKIIHPEWTTEEALKWREMQRNAHPYYTPWEKNDDAKYTQFFMQSSGGNFDLVKATALRAGAHIITDIKLRWRELEFDRLSAGSTPPAWQPFAKAMQQTKFGYLEKIRLEDALRLRKEERLESFRHFLNKVWRASVRNDPMSEENAASLASELADKVREAQEEWRKIDRDLLQHFKTYTGLAAAVGWGAGAFMPAAVAAVIGGGVDLSVAQHRRSNFEHRFPAAFFLQIKN